MIQRRASERGLKVRIGCHTFRATGFTAHLEAGGTPENAQAMGGARKSAHHQALRPHRR
jgi:integrase/recombinase XerD